MIVKVEHLLLFVVIFLMCYNLFSSCGCGNSLVDGFSVGGQLDSETDRKIPLCCRNLWNKLPDDIQKLRGKDTVQKCRNAFMEYLLDEKNIDFSKKNGQYASNFACNTTDIMNYCSYKDTDLHKWKNTEDQNVIDINSSNTENSCDFLQFLNNTKMVVKNCKTDPEQPGCEYGENGYKHIVDEWIKMGESGTPYESEKWSTLKPQNPKRKGLANLCIEGLNWMHLQANPDWSDVKNNGFFNIPYDNELVYCGGDVSSNPAINSTFGTNLDNLII